MKTPQFALTWLFSIALLTPFGNPTAARATTNDQALSTIGKALDQAQSRIDEYGTLSISTPVLVYGQSNQFSFNLTNGAYYYFTNAKSSIQGKAAAFDQRAQTLIISGQANVDLTALISPAIAGLQELAKQLGTNSPACTNTLGPTNTTPPPLPRGTNNNILPVLPNPSALRSDTNGARLMGLLPFLNLIGNQPAPTISDRSAIITAAGNNAVEAIFRALGEPEAREQFVNKNVLIGLTTVSVNPGWRTQKGWEGDVLVRADLEFKFARQETIRRVLAKQQSWPDEVLAKIAWNQIYPFMTTNGWETKSTNRMERLMEADVPGDRARKLAEIGYSELERVTEVLDTNLPAWGPKIKTPCKPLSIIIVSPLNDVDTYDLASSYRKQSETALSLSFALHYIGAEGAAKAFEQYSKSLQLDVQTRNALAAVNSFSSQDGVIGFRIGPRPRALTDLSKPQSKPGYVLEKQSFPALLLLGIGAGDMEPRLEVTNKSIIVYEPYIALHQFSHWVPLSHHFLWFNPKLGERTRMEAADALEKVRLSLSALGWTNPFSISKEQSTLEYAAKDRLRFFESQLIGCVNDITLPMERMVPEPPRKEAQVIDVFPSQIKLHFNSGGDIDQTPFTFILRGTNLDTVSSSITSLYPNTTVLTNLPPSSSLLVVQAMVTNSGYPVIFTLSPGSSPPIYSPPVLVQSAVSVPRVLAVEPKTVTLNRNPNGSAMPAEVDLVMVGSGLTKIDISNAKVATGFANLSKIEFLGDGLKATLTITNAGQAVTIELPIKDLPGNYILSRPVQVDFATAKSTP